MRRDLQRGVLGRELRAGGFGHSIHYAGKSSFEEGEVERYRLYAYLIISEGTREVMSLGQIIIIYGYSIGCDNDLNIKDKTGMIRTRPYQRED